MEIWKDINGYKGIYQISNLGRLRRWRKTSKFWANLSDCSHPGGYRRVKLRNSGNDKDAYIHRLVAEAFIPNPNNYNEVNHIDGDRANNNLSNLEWVNRMENSHHAFKNKNASSKYVGVNYVQNRNKWRVRIMINGVRKCVGEYKTELGAYLAYVNASEKAGIVNKYL